MNRKAWAVLAAVLALALILSVIFLYRQSNEESITPNNEFFYVSLTPPLEINASEWSLVVDGKVDVPLNITYEELRSMPNRSVTATLRCVTGPSGRAEWVGVPLSYVLDLAHVQASAVKVVFYAPDGFSTDLKVQDAKLDDVLLAYSMNNDTLPASQGYPVRLVVPEQWGYKWAKWVTHIELVDYDYHGYWESRGWADNAYISPPTDWRWHAAAMSVAMFIGGYAAVSGAINARGRKRGEPNSFPARYHRLSGYIFSLVVIGVFLWWALQTYSIRGSVFYTLHGILALVTVIFVAFGLITGPILFRRNEKARLWHRFFAITGFILLLITVITGLLQAFR